MKTKPKYFPITINAGSPEKLAARIADNEIRGFELVMSAEVEDSKSNATNSSYLGSDGVRRRYKVDSTYKTYRAEMRRPNREYNE